MNGAIGLVAGLPAEARTVAGRGHWERLEGRVCRRFSLKAGIDLMIVRAGLGLENALSAARWLVGNHVAAMGVLGVSGGLAPAMKAGDLVLADTVVQKGGREDGTVWSGRSLFVEKTLTALTASVFPVYLGAIISVQRPVLSAQDKNELFDQTGALAVDMESAGVSLAAQEAGIPFFALRAVCDGSSCTIPQDLFDCVNQDGRVRLLHLFRVLLVKPALFFELRTMKRDFAAALSSLGRAWHTEIKGILPELLQV